MTIEFIHETLKRLAFDYQARCSNLSFTDPCW